MITNNLLVGKYYTLKYNKPWTDFELKDVKVSSITTESESASYGVGSIFADFFSKYNLTISKYVEYMSISSEIYVCQAITDKSIAEVDNNLLLLPKVLIDFPNSEELLLCDNVVVTVGGLLNHEELAFDRGTYYANLTKHIREALRKLEEYGDSLLSVNITSSNILKAISEYEKYNNFRTYTHNIQKLATEQEILKHNKDLKAMIEKSNELTNSISSYNALIADLDQSIANFNEARTAYSQVAQTVRTNGNILFTGLENGSIVPNSVEYFIYRTAIMDSVEIE